MEEMNEWDNKKTLNVLYETLYHKAWDSVNYDRLRCEWAWKAFWSLLIQIGFRFPHSALSDVKALCGTGYYAKTYYSPDESHYSQAVMVGNLSFCAAYEAYVGRSPFICKNVEYDHVHGEIPGYRKGTQGKSQGRLILGAWFVWGGGKVKVTSFNDKEQSLKIGRAHV